VRESIRIGRLAGFPVSLHWSVAVIAWLLGWSLAVGVLPTAAPGQPVVVYWVVGFATAVVFLASLLAHELAHAVTAQHVGIGVDRVELWIFGGVAHIRGEARTAADDFRIAAVGPATSLGLAVVFVVIAGVLAVAGAGDLAVAAVSWLAAINVVLGVFNLIPGAPLDGGRLLRAYLWWRSGDRDRAAVRAARAGQGVGYALIALGVLEFAVGLGVGGLWMVFIGWFVLNAARAEEVSVRTRSVVAGVRVCDVMTRQPRTVPSWVTVTSFVDTYILGSRHSAYPVEAPDGRTIGLVTLAQVRTVPAGSYTTARVGDIAIPMARVAAAAPGEPLEALFERLTPAGGNRVLVFDGERLVGIVTATDITRAVEVRALQRADHGWASEHDESPARG
jgi:Zn-dependent protease